MSDRIRSLDDFLILLKGVKPGQAGQYTALCPGHDDRQRSLSVKQADGKILIKCFAGCDTADILKPLNLEAKDLFLNSRQAKLVQREIEVVYHYVDANGSPFEVVRTKPKGFYQRRPDGKGSYVNNLKGIVSTLYHQDKLQSAIGAAAPIYFVEGEKDVDRLWTLGLTATTNPMGAGKWRNSYSEALRGADLVVIPDNDDPGYAHATKVATSCYGKAKRVRFLALPGEYRDASHYLDSGGTAEQLKQLAGACPDYEPPAEAAELVTKFAFRLTDLGNAERLVHQFGGLLRYCYERKRWLVWNNKTCEWDYGAKIMALAKKTARNILHEAANEEDDDKRKALIKHAMRSESEVRLSAMVTLARYEQGIPVTGKDLNSNPWLFNCRNGTIDLRTGEFHPHNREDLITIMSPVTYNPNSSCELWMKFLDRVTDGSTDLIQYLQRAVGYSLTGDMRAQVLFFLYGLGNNGKSTFITTIRKIMAGYGATAPVDMFLAKDKIAGGPKESLANLQGKRFIAASEIEAGRRLAVVVIKEMTGGEAIQADRKYEHEVEFQPTHKLWVSGNHKPSVVDTSLAIWRRIKLIPFTVTIPDKEINEDLPRELEAELSGILTWAVEGCLAWQQDGLKEPREVTTATLAYRQEEDILADFLEDCCAFEPLATIPKADLKEAYQKWCQDNSTALVKQRTFKTRLVERGISEGRVGRTRYWRGVRLRTEIDDKSDKTLGGLDTEVTTVTENPETSPCEANVRKLSEKSVTPVTLVTDSPKTKAREEKDLDQTPDYPK